MICQGRHSCNKLFQRDIQGSCDSSTTSLEKLPCTPIPFTATPSKGQISVMGQDMPLLTVVILTHSPETILLLRSLSSIEAQYLARSSNKITEAIGQTYSGGARAPSGSSEGINVARIVVNEMDAARFDPLLVKAVAKNTATCLDNILNRLEALVS